MKNDITILYIDDVIDNDVSQYLTEYLKIERCKIIEKVFDDNENLEMIINSNEVKSADIILIDSKLFERENYEEFFSGEDIKTIIRDVYPYKEVFVISQNDLNSDVQRIKKYSNSGNNKRDFKKIMQHYKNEIEEKIKASINNIDEYRYVIHSKKHNSMLKNEFDRLSRILNSEIEYSDLKKEDVDKLVDEIKEINKILYGNK